MSEIGIREHRGGSDDGLVVVDRARPAVLEIGSAARPNGHATRRSSSRPR